MKTRLLLLSAVGCTLWFGLGVCVSAQTPDSAVSGAVEKNTTCNSFALQMVDELTLKQRGCFYTRQLLSPGFALSSVTLAAFDQFRNSPVEPHERWGKFPHRIEPYYARHAARDMGEFIVGALHHEDPRPHQSTTGSIWKRTNAAMMSVLTSPDDDGHLRPAFAPVAGSVSSAFVGTLMYRHSETLPTTMTRAGLVYGFYFARAVFAEFKPDIAAVVHKFIH